MKILISIILVISMQSCIGQENSKSSQYDSFKVTKTNAEWQELLSPEAYYVLRESGTERAFSSPLNNNEVIGIYECAACKTPLFKSENKFDSGTGWPSFDQEIVGNVAYSKDGSAYYGFEEHCATCGSHLGHIFNDGPKNTTGKRHCINGVALNFVPKK
ncbi:peptide-methionine (R)-S-oxide reductase MsrB [Bizionia arctica]|uniref:peptide-methionine (R)-S-oxide reductase n=1 Tax=Bizionia arctica TaxID=1495645 RepID=A0A917GLG5_9FLAO|nr:peptide-methionine (R)-S-oxide reductase MsrB [Bizionia arctica]GGG50113.1 peptide-methionine (R)-S-oxide reductase [Bizionia arctica]